MLTVNVYQRVHHSCPIAVPSIWPLTAEVTQGRAPLLKWGVPGAVQSADVGGRWPWNKHWPKIGDTLNWQGESGK